MYLTPLITAHNSVFLSNMNTGLGNVLFQIASCYGLAKDTNRQIAWNNLVKFGDKLHNTFGFNHRETIFRKCLMTADVVFVSIKERKVWEYDQEFVDLLKSDNNSVELDGYLECIDYFHKYKSDIVDLFSPDDTSLEFIKTTYPVLFDPQYTTISIHFRGNEYLHHPQIGQAWDYNFYTRAVAYFKEKFNNVLFLVFSDDMERIDFSFLNDSRYVKMPNTCDYIDLWCISLCKHSIVSRSTFSFWGGYLNQTPGAIVVYNKNFIKPYHSLFVAV